MDTATFIREAHVVHGARYDYSDTCYINAREKVAIRCLTHGVFTQRPSSHLGGYGCKKCALDYTAQKKVARRILKVCSACGGEFTLTPSAANRGEGKYCSRECYSKHIASESRECASCGVSFTPKNQASKYCSQECATNAITSLKEDVICRFHETHGDRYDYSKVHYVNMNTPVSIVCSIHGEWKQRPADHILGRGCTECAKMVIASKRRAAASQASVSCMCSICSKTFQLPPAESRRRKYCSNRCASKGNKLSREDFINYAKTVHGDTYSYGKVVIPENGPTKLVKVIIGCPIHNDFAVTIGGHLKGAGCPFCSGQRINLATFLERAGELNSKRHCPYDYSLVKKIVSSSERITIICPKHGTFSQTVSRHLAGDGCRECAIELRGTANSDRASATWIERARKVHGETYDYSRSEYVSAKEKIAIVCSKHGMFWQGVNNHLNGAGCPACGVGGFDSTKPGMVYYIRVSDDKSLAWKIGITNFDVAHRFRSEDVSIVILKTWTFEEGRHALEMETDILNRFRSMRYKGPPILCGGGNTELFEADVLGLDKLGLATDIVTVLD